jgi:lipopolysaccharide transport system permease protein
MLEDLRELFRFRELLKNLVVKELRVRYKESTLGFFWSLFTPLLNTVIYTLVFSVVMRIDVPNYPIFLLSGLFAWTFTQTSIAAGCVSVVHNGSLVKKVYFPTEILPISIVFSNFVNFLLSLLVFLVFLLGSGVGIHPSIISLPLIFLIQICFTLGVSFFVAVYTVYFRDIEHFIGVLLFAMFYVTPVIYPITKVPPKFQIYLQLNPLTPIIEAYQRVLYKGQFPNWVSLGVMGVISIVLLIAGYAVFTKHKGLLPEEV